MHFTRFNSCVVEMTLSFRWKSLINSNHYAGGAIEVYTHSLFFHFIHEWKLSRLERTNISKVTIFYHRFCGVIEKAESGSFLRFNYSSGFGQKSMLIRGENFPSIKKAFKWIAFYLLFHWEQTNWHFIKLIVEKTF